MLYSLAASTDAKFGAKIVKTVVACPESTR